MSIIDDNLVYFYQKQAQKFLLNCLVHLSVWLSGRRFSQSNFYLSLAERQIT